MPEHGGNLNDAVARFGRARGDWVDVSTGINPAHYPVPPLPDNAWHRLPEVSKELEQAAAAYYGFPACVAVAGTQAAIQALPRLRARCRVCVCGPSYAEHAWQWQQAGHEVIRARYAELEQHLPQVDVMVVVNPNNPTGETIAPTTLLAWREQLASRGGWLIVDEAFGDTVPELSIAKHSDLPGLWVLRSVGKFFGLAGLRLGFVGASANLLAQLSAWLGPWAVSGPAQIIARQALSDSAWQQHNRQFLQQQGQRLRNLLTAHGWQSQGTELFQWCSHVQLQHQTEALWEHFAQHGIWVRYFDHSAWSAHGLRFGLPATEADWQRLEQACQRWKRRETT
ncbi:threonine-phosphate decarboxylase CobD [Undibacterium squillarum]|uniref:threonine-phosphate decarboxylase CobD n=1 Tax=Undibacterium squillarum TaxID=1131567 RepID=UPI0035B2319E